MALPGELAGLNGVTCDCGKELELSVCQSAAGYYLGYFCPNCGPYSCETAYYSNREDAELDLEKALRGEDINTVRTTEYRTQEFIVVQDKDFKTHEEMNRILSSFGRNDAGRDNPEDANTGSGELPF